MIVMKFGGTSVANAQAITRVVDIVRGRLDRTPVIVVSAMSKVTDALYNIAQAALDCDKATVSETAEYILGRHLSVADELIGNHELKETTKKRLTSICSELLEIIDAVSVLGELTSRNKVRIIGVGEILSSTLIAAVLNDKEIATELVDARDFIITDGDMLKAEPVIDIIQTKTPKIVDPALETHKAVITQGFIASNRDGLMTVLGRGGSDYSASLIGMALNAEAIEIWTDVDGVRTADPRRVANTKNIERISFEEAAEMAHFGAKVLHPLTIEPAVMKNIPVYVLNSLNPDGKGTQILQSDRIADGVKSVSFKENILLMNIYSTKMINISGFLMKVFDIFARHNVSVDLISTSEANISVTIEGNQDISGVTNDLSEIAEVHVDNDKSQISIIGKNVAKQRGMLRWVMNVFKSINLYMISQAASSDNVSFVVDCDQLDDALQEIHGYLFDY